MKKPETVNRVNGDGDEIVLDPSQYSIEKVRKIEIPAPTDNFGQSLNNLMVNANQGTIEMVQEINDMFKESSGEAELKKNTSLTKQKDGTIQIVNGIHFRFAKD